ncbi:MAG: helix-turn-helix transcriptional regulator [Acidobacteria bacterium]|nr:helix-turn-helix transcriptional regulator [Acidobacteriota bacterium]
MKSGAALRQYRLRSGVTTREVEAKSKCIAEAERSEEFYVSNAWLTKLENTDSIPGIHKLFTLSVIYHVGFSELLNLYGVDLAHIGLRQFEVVSPRTQLVAGENEPRDEVLPIQSQSGFDLNRTNLFSRMVGGWSDVPFAVLQHLRPRQNIYGFVGLQDYTLYPLLRPGSFVQIDPHLRRIQTLRWRTEFDRPIYFLELRDGYACGWCEVQGNELALLPHPLSPCTTRRFLYPGDAEVVGRVTGFATRFCSKENSSA